VQDGNAPAKERKLSARASSILKMERLKLLTTDFARSTELHRVHASCESKQQTGTPDV
jgi:hypothetical protein